MIHLTFDDGPDPRWTPAALDALAAAGALATFFVLGQSAAEHPGLVTRMLAEGHSVEVHGHEHLRHLACARVRVENDLDAALAVLGGLGIAPRLWRVPWGDLAPFTTEVARERGLALAGWTVDTNDWRGGDAATMLVAVAPGLRRGAIVLAHDGLGPGAQRRDCAETVRLIGPLVAEARRRGLEPVPLDPAATMPPGGPGLAGTAAPGEPAGGSAPEATSRGAGR